MHLNQIRYLLSAHTSIVGHSKPLSGWQLQCFLCGGLSFLRFSGALDCKARRCIFGQESEEFGRMDVR